MISKMNLEPRGLYIPPSALSLACLALLTVSAALAQDRISPAGQANSNASKRTHVATIHSSNSSEGSRVAITSDQSLNNYEAYRRGDRFYVKIPATDVARAESARGRGFADITSQRSGDGTVLSFRLEPGASAHVEQRGNKLDVVVSVPGGTAAANRAPDVNPPVTSEPSRTADAGKRTNAKSNNPESNKNGNVSNSLLANSDAGKVNESSRDSGSASAPGNANPGSSSTVSSDATPNAGNSLAAASGTQTTPAASAPPPAANSTASPATAAAGTARTAFWAQAKERGHYWLLLAQLNPIPVALGATLLVFIIMWLLFQRHRARSTQSFKGVTTSTAKAAAVSSAAELNNGTETALSAETATVVAVTPLVAEPAAETPVAVPAVVPVSEDPRRGRSSRAGEEARKLLAGDRYDESFVGSEDPETRRLVSAELLSALVSRNVVRRERARAAFMKHGYFDDATRDLRISDSENERAAAARRLSFVNDREATPHLIGALSDPSPDVRRAAVEALMDVRDPAAIAPLNALVQNEKDRKVPRHLIQKAIEACATSRERAVPETPISPAHMPPPATLNTDREVIEI
jgi:hypothetical protein